MKIVFLSYLHGFGGAEKQNVMLANSMAARGHNVTLISISVDNNCYKLDEKVKYLYLPDRKTGFLRIITRFQDIKKSLKQIKPDITVNFWFQSAYMTAMMSKRITGCVIYSERGDPGDQEYNGLVGLIRKITLPKINGFVFQSKGALEYFNNKVQSRSVVIPNPVFINLDKYPDIKKRRKVIVTVGRLHPQKNHKLLIDAFNIFSKTEKNYNLEIYGDGELREELQSYIDSLNLSDRVFLKGTSPEIHRLILDASLFVLSSDYEGLPNTLLEAMALGIPCISTDCRPGGAREIIDDNIDGLIVECGNADSLAEAISLLSSDEQLMKEFSKRSKIKMLHFNSEDIYSQWESFLKRNTINNDI